MNISTVNDEMNITHEHYINQPMQPVELKLNMINAKNPHLIKTLNRYNNQPVIRKYSSSKSVS